MKNLDEIKERYMRDALPVRLAGLAANLARIRSTARLAANRDVVANLIEESKYFIEWTAREADVDAQAELATLQIELARWKLQWASICPDDARRRELGEHAGMWSNRILDMSGLPV